MSLQNFILRNAKDVVKNVENCFWTYTGSQRIQHNIGILYWQINTETFFYKFEINYILLRHLADGII